MIKLLTDPAACRDEWLAKSWFPPLVLAAAAALFLLPATSSMPLMDRDEPRFAQATWEMMERGEWFIPYFNDGYRFDKPVLSYWWMRVHYWMFGKTEFGARLHSVVSAYLTSLVIFFMGSRFFSRPAGFLSAFAWLTCAQVLVHGRLCVADMPMLLGVALSMYGILVLLSSKADPPRFGKWFWVLAGGLVLGFLAKGPVATLVPVLALVLSRFLFCRQPLPWHRLQPVSLALVYLVGIGLWGVPALIETDGKFWDKGMGEHVIDRGLGAFNNRITIPVVYYLVTGIISLLPWSAFLPSAFRNPSGWRNWPLVPSLLLGWFVAPFLVFGFYATQLPHYVMPGFPGFFLLLFRGGTSGLGDFRRWFWTVTVTVLGLGLVIAVLAVVSPVEGELVPLRHLLLLAGGLFAMMALFCVLIRFGRWRRFAFASVVFAILVAGLGSTLRTLSPIPEIRQAWSDREVEDPQYHWWVFEEPSLVFYLGKTWHKDRELPEVVAWLREDPSRAAVFRLREWRLDDQLQSILRGNGFTTEPDTDYTEPVRSRLPPEDFELEVVRGLNIARSSWVELLLCEPKKPSG